MTDVSLIALLPCPFCDSPAGYKHQWAYCSNPECWLNEHGVAPSIWNARHPSAPDTGQLVNRLKAVVAKLSVGGKGKLMVVEDHEFETLNDEQIAIIVREFMGEAVSTKALGLAKESGNAASPAQPSDACAFMSGNHAHMICATHGGCLSNDAASKGATKCDKASDAPLPWCHGCYNRRPLESDTGLCASCRPNADAPAKQPVNPYESDFGKWWVGLNVEFRHKGGDYDLAKAAWDAATEVRQREIPDVWRPITKAPRDGTHILAVIAGFSPLEAWWDSDYDEWTNYPLRAEMDKPEEDRELGGPWEPTHWMPLPPPPTTGGNLQKPTASEEK